MRGYWIDYLSVVNDSGVHGDNLRAVKEAVVKVVVRYGIFTADTDLSLLQVLVVGVIDAYKPLRAGRPDDYVMKIVVGRVRHRYGLVVVRLNKIMTVERVKVEMYLAERGQIESPGGAFQVDSDDNIIVILIYVLHTE
jgi:hypothetical protein